MNRVAAALFLVLAAALVIAGLVAGLAPLPSASGGSCGSVFAPTTSSGMSFDSILVDEFCKTDRGGRARTTWVLLGLGAAAAVVGAVGLARPKPDDR